MSRIVLVEVDDGEPQRLDGCNIRSHSLAFMRAVVQLMENDCRDSDVTRFLTPGSPRQLGFRVIQKRNYGVGIQEVLHDPNSLSRSGRSVVSGCSSAASRKSWSSVPAIASSQSHVSGTGSRMIWRPRLFRRTSRASTRNSFGSRTACDRPDQNTFAVSIVHLLRYTNEI